MFQTKIWKLSNRSGIRSKSYFEAAKSQRILLGPHNLLRRKQFGSREPSQRIPIALAVSQSPQPQIDQSLDFTESKTFVTLGILTQIRSRQTKQRAGRTQSIFLKVHKSPRQLDQSFVEMIILTLPTRQPKLFQNIVGLVVEPLIEAIKETQIMRRPSFALLMGDEGRYLTAFVTHILVPPEFCYHTRPLILTSEASLNKLPLWLSRP